MTQQFNAAERAILRIVQADLPDTLTPYADIANDAGVSEAEVLDLLTRLKSSGIIRRFGASIKHQKTGWTHNAMVVWKVDAAQLDSCGKTAAQHERISHVYYRPTKEPDWTYTLYTMIHGKSEADCQSVIDNLRSIAPFDEYAVLKSLKELKKISMTYF